MADVSIKYKSNVIAEMSEEGTKTLKTSGCYCEGDIEVAYSPSSSGGGGSTETNHRIYEITLAKASGWVLLTKLDDDVLTHINDASFAVSLTPISSYVYEFYAGSIYIASNTPWGYSGSYPAYGLASREASATSCQTHYIYYPPNNTGTNTGIGGGGMFRIDGSNYYLMPGDGFIKGGTYRLVFTW